VVTPRTALPSRNSLFGAARTTRCYARREVEPMADKKTPKIKVAKNSNYLGTLLG
jgi:hypothetical protein